MYTPLLYSKAGVCRGISIFVIFAPKHRVRFYLRTENLLIFTTFIHKGGKHYWRLNGPVNAHLILLILSLRMRKPTICICENKDADQLCSNCTADQRLCFRHTNSTILLLLIYPVSSIQLYSVIVQPGLCPTWSETQFVGFLMHRLNKYKHVIQTFHNTSANEQI